MRKKGSNIDATSSTCSGGLTSSLGYVAKANSHIIGTSLTVSNVNIAVHIDETSSITTSGATYGTAVTFNLYSTLLCCCVLCC